MYLAIEVDVPADTIMFIVVAVTIAAVIFIRRKYK